MEQARSWLWTKRRHSKLSSHDLQASTNDDSWEEQAFAADEAGPIGGCIWPPRSYSCSFCRREFRSAQALGGHMNIHRRDRARLKQSPGDHHPHNEILYHDHHNNKNPFSSLRFHHQYPSQVCTLVYSPNPNSDHPGVLASPSSPSRVSAPPSSSQENNCCHEQAFFSPSSSLVVQQHPKRSSISTPKSCANSATDRYYQFFDPRAEREKNTRVEESRYRAKVDYVKTDLPVSLNLVVHQSRQTVSSGKEEGTIYCKRRRIDSSSLPFFMKPSSSIDKHHIQSEELELINPTSIGDLDLELRLGDWTKVKQH